MTAGAARVRSSTWRWVALALVVIAAFSALSAYLTNPRPGGRMDPGATGPAGAHALVTLLRDRGVQVVIAGTVADVTAAARADTLVLMAETQHITGADQFDRLAHLPGDLLLVAPDARAREALSPGVRKQLRRAFTAEPGCDLPAANRAGSVDLRGTETYAAAPGQSIISCYDGALVRYRAGDRTVTVVGDWAFMTNAGLPRDGNAALAMNLTGERPRLIWYAPQQIEGGTSGAATIFDLIPQGVTWLVWQLCLALAVAALWKGRRLGPLVSEPLPVVVRASETVKGLGRLYRAHRTRDRAAAALRSACLQRLTPRLGLGPATDPSALTAAVAHRMGTRPDWVWHTLFGPAPSSEADLVQLARALDDIERQVTHS